MELKTGLNCKYLISYLRMLLSGDSLCILETESKKEAGDCLI